MGHSPSKPAGSCQRPARHHTAPSRRHLLAPHCTIPDDPPQRFNTIAHSPSAVRIRADHAIHPTVSARHPPPKHRASISTINDSSTISHDKGSANEPHGVDGSGCKTDDAKPGEALQRQGAVTPEKSGDLLSDHPGTTQTGVGAGTNTNDSEATSNTNEVSSESSAAGLGGKTKVEDQTTNTEEKNGKDKPINFTMEIFNVLMLFVCTLARLCYVLVNFVVWRLNEGQRLIAAHGRKLPGWVFRPTKSACELTSESMSSLYQSIACIWGSCDCLKEGLGPSKLSTVPMPEARIWDFEFGDGKFEGKHDWRGYRAGNC